MKNCYYILFSLLFYGFGAVGQVSKNPADSLKRVFLIAKTDTAKVNILNKMADAFKESNPDSTSFYALKAEALAKQARYDFGVASAYINSGNANIILGNYRQANQYFSKAQSLFESLLHDAKEPEIKRIQNGLAKAFASQGIVFSQQSNYYMALEMYQKALKVYLKIGDQVSTAKAYNNIGIVYKSQQKNNLALAYFKKAFQVQQAITEPTAAVTLTNIGVIYAEQGNKNQAFDCYKKAEKLFATTNNQRGFALLNNYFGDYYKSEKNYTQAEVYYNKALALYEAMQNKFGASLARYNLGRLHADLKNYDQAIDYAEKSLADAKAIGILDQIYHSEKLLSDLYGIQHNTELSFAHYRNYIVARDSITNQENSKKMLRSEMESEYKRRAAVLAEQSKRNTQLGIFTAVGLFLLAGLIFVTYNRRQIKRRLTLQKEVAEYEQKALHLQMNPHFVFNCLGSISSFIVQNGTDSALKYLAKFSKLMRLTLEYSKGSLIPIDKEIESLKNYLELEQLRFHNKFEFEIQSSDKVEFNMGIPPLLIQPFVENAILHGMVPKKGNGKIDVFFDVQNGQFLCSISDDGIGLTQSRLLKEDSVAAHKSMALEITKKRLEIMEATTLKSAQIDIREREDNGQVIGTQVILRLPIQYIQ
ncbi:tetratricopeptide repeat protein [Flavobacterium sp. CYK-4]|uniref:tetratricopeptide repeat-containing sensor histidine kinase n=1 Tax=Flavobacterium lotistagni TaxID=2709660 RepID=UPI0014090F1E|nr:tetratricopeptide repeat protein [Flavobacterium lotistagni]NHM06485.1 tetratricopeptide repeat protein [Flavobacterium lotistagni]